MEEASHYTESDALPAIEIGVTEATAERLTPALDRIYEEIEKVQVELPKTEEVLYKVVEAAEHSQAIEKIFELRHEVKDTPKSLQGNAAVSVGTVLQQRTDHIRLTRQAPTPNKKTSLGVFAVLLPPKNSLYGQAVRYGFITALFALALSAALVLLFT